MTVPPPTPNMPLNAPAAVPIAASFNHRSPLASLAGTGGDTRCTCPLPARPPASTPCSRRCATTPRPSAVLCDVDGTLAPIVERAADARVPADTAELLASLARRYALVGCVSGRRRRRGAGARRPRRARLHRKPRLRAPAARRRRGERRPGPARPRGRRGPVSRGRRRAPGLDAAGLRLEDKGPIRALHWRGAPDEAGRRAARRASSRRGRRRPASPRTGGARCSSCAPRSRSTRAPRSPSCCAASRSRRRSTAATTAPTSTPFAACARWRGRASSVPPSASGSRRARARPRSPAEADAVVDGPAGFAEVLRMLE